MDRQTTVGRRIARFFVLCSVVATVVLVVVVTTRLSDDALSLVLGIVIGVAALLTVLVPVVAVVYLMVRWTEARSVHAISTPPPQQQPIYLMPQAAPAQTPYQLPPAADIPVPTAQRHAARQFTVIGGED